MYLTILRDTDYCDVWLALERGNPLTQPHSFIVGTGKTREDAVGDAVKTLEAVVDLLQSPPGVIRERRSHVI